MLTPDQDCTIWQANKNSFGEYAFERVFVKCRHAERNELFVNAEGDRDVAKGIFYMTFDAKVGDFIQIGKSSLLRPPPVAHRIKGVIGAKVVTSMRKVMV